MGGRRGNDQRAGPVGFFGCTYVSSRWEINAALPIVTVYMLDCAVRVDRAYRSINARNKALCFAKRINRGIGAEPCAKNAQAGASNQITGVAPVGVVTVRVRDDGALYGAPGINVEISCGAIQARVG